MFAWMNRKLSIELQFLSTKQRGNHQLCKTTNR